MKKIEANTLEQAYKDAAKHFECSVTELNIEVVQRPTNGFLGMFKKSAIIVAVKTVIVQTQEEENPKNQDTTKNIVEAKNEDPVQKEEEKEELSQTILNDTIMPASFVNDQDEEDDDLGSGLDYTADYDDEYDEEYEDNTVSDEIDTIANEIEEEINNLFQLTCFNIDKIEVSRYDKETLLVEFKGDDAALLIGKEGYRYKALSYMIFNWINAKYDIQLRLEIAEFLQNQEESIGRYLESVYDNVERDGRAQTKILDGVLVQIALKELRNKYPDKYVVIRSTRDGLKYIIINDYYNN